MRKYCAVVLAVMILLVCSCAWGDVPIDAVHFPDEAFREYVRGEFDTDSDNVLSDGEIARITEIDVNSKGITSLKGIEYCVSLDSLYCDCNQLTDIDISNNTLLRLLTCSSNDLTQLDLSKNKKLRYLACDSNDLTVLNLSNNTSLDRLHCSSNQLVELDLSNNTALLGLWCNGNSLRKLDLSNTTTLLWLECSNNLLAELDLGSNEVLSRLYCSNNQLVELDVSKISGLGLLYCFNNQLIELNLGSNEDLRILDCSDNQLTELDLSNNQRLYSLNCSDNQLTELDLGNNPVLEELFCTNNQLTILDLRYCTSIKTWECDSNVNVRTLTENDIAINKTNFPDDTFRENVRRYDYNSDGILNDNEIKRVNGFFLMGSDISSLKGIEYFKFLTWLDCSYNRLTSLDVSGCSNLTELDCECNQLVSLDVSGCPALERLDCADNQLIRLDVSGCSALRELYCYDNQLTELVINGCSALEQLWCEGNQLIRLNVSGCSALRELYCYDNQLTELVINGCSALKDLKCRDNRLTELNVSVCPALTYLDCDGNHLVSIDVANNIALIELMCGDNQLMVLDLSNNTSLTKLNARKNKLADLDVSKNISLTQLSCWDNSLIQLDVSKNTALISLECNSNDISELDVSKNTALTSLWCAQNKLVTLDVGKNIALTSLWCEKNKLVTLDVSNNTALRYLVCYSNDISELDVSNHQRLFCLNCGNNRISVLDLTNKPNLQQVACARNQIRELDVTGSSNLYSLYCYNNPIRTLDVTHNPNLQTLSCTNILISELDISQNPLLRQLDCGGNYLAALDVSHNPELRELYYSGTTLRNVDVSKNIHLVSLDCISTDIMTLDISANSSLDALGCYGNSRLEALYITSSDNPAYPYATDLREYTGDSFARVTALSAYTRTGSPIPASFVPGQPVALFAQLPHYIVYDYSTGYTGTASTDSVPRTMHVKISVPSLNFTYLPKIESKVVSVDSKVVSVDEAVTFHATSITPNTPEPEPSTPDSPSEPEPEIPDSPVRTFSGSSSGGCNSGLGIFALGLVILVLLSSRKRTGLFAVILLLAFASSSRAANIKAADYTLPIPYDTYTISGTYSTNFALTPELVNTVAQIANISADRVHSFADIALPETWNVLPIDLYNLSRSGEYGGIVLPLTSTGTQDDRYILHCTFSNDIQPGEQISLHGFEVDTQTRESVYDENKSYLAAFIVLDENLTRIEYVPENRRVYIALSLRPEYVNTGIVTVVRGRYVEEEDPVYRLGTDAAQRIADDLGIHLEDLKYLTRANIGRPVEPTDAMKVYVASDDHEIIINMPTISVDEEGRYIIPITLSDDEFELVRSRDVREFKTYALNDSELGKGQMRPAFITGLISTWELYTLNGEKLETFGVKEFLLVGLLQAGKPFSLYLAKLIIMLLLGGCNLGTGIFAGGFVILVMMLVKNRSTK